MEKDDKGCSLIRLGEGVSVSSGTGLPELSRTKAVKRLCVCVCSATPHFDSVVQCHLTI